MNRWMDLKTVLIAAAFAAIGFFAAERMQPAAAAPLQQATDPSISSFSGASGTTTVVFDREKARGYVIVVRDGKLWRVAIDAASGAARPWVTLSD